MKNFDIVLVEKRFDNGLTREEIQDLLSKIDGDEIYPIDLCHECSAMGFVTPNAAKSLDFNYLQSGLEFVIANILDDLNNESEDGAYEFKGLRIWLSR